MGGTTITDPPEPRSRPTRVGIDLDGDHARVSDLEPGEFLVPRVLGVAGRTARVALVGHSATLLAGDRLAVEVRVGAGAHLELVEPSATVAYNARGGRASWSATVEVGAGGSLTWQAAEFVVAGGADVTRDLVVSLAPEATAGFHELLVLGRSGEQGGALLTRTRVSCAGRPLLVETLDLRDVAERSAPGIIGTHRVLGSVLVAGTVPVPHDADQLTTVLAGPGALTRVVTDHAHEAQAALAPAWHRGRAAVRAAVLAAARAAAPYAGQVTGPDAGQAEVGCVAPTGSSSG